MLPVLFCQNRHGGHDEASVGHRVFHRADAGLERSLVVLKSLSGLQKFFSTSDCWTGGAEMVATRRAVNDTPAEAQPDNQPRPISTKRSTGSRTGGSRRNPGSAARELRSSYHREVKGRPPIIQSQRVLSRAGKLHSIQRPPYSHHLSKVRVRRRSNVGIAGNS